MWNGKNGEVNNMIPSVEIPIGEKGDYRIERKYVEPTLDFSSLKTGRCVPKGKYTFLYRNNKLVMSDTPDEKRDHIVPVNKAKGNCLIAGLGIGMVLNAIALKKEVIHIDVIEISQDVIDLVSPYYEKNILIKYLFIVHQFLIGNLIKINTMIWHGLIYGMIYVLTILNK